MREGVTYEKTKRQTNAAHHSRIQSIFRCNDASFSSRYRSPEPRLVEIYIAKDDCWHGKHTTHPNCEEDEACLLGIKPIHALKHKRERSKERKQDRKIKPNIETEEADNRFRNKHMNGAEDRDGEEEFYLGGCGGER